MDEKKSAGLIELLNGTTVEANLSANSWEEAVELVGEVMASAGVVEAPYIEAMKETIRKFGPYCVIAPGVAMPHARPEDGVLKPGFALITLKTPVEFGSSANDPVDIVIGFAAENKERHIEALRELATYFGNNGFVHRIRSARSKEEIINGLKIERKES
jgi:PTS system ascorbate-specific IIA component